MAESTRTSGCWCGAVRTEITGEPAAMAYCHCESCRSWLSAPIHAASLWPTDQVRVTHGEDQLGVHAKTEASLRHFCRTCGSGVLIRHPVLGLTDVPAGSVHGLVYAPTIHVHYGEKVLSVSDGLPKYRDMPADFGGSGDLLDD